MNILTKITANGIDFKVGNPTLVTWDSTKNMNDFKTQGVYEIYGERTVKTDNLPITNEGDGHSIAARLTVVASTLQPANNEICVTQFLQLSNRIGGEGSTYVRTYNENNNSMNGWSPWQKQMGMVETYMSSDTLTIDVDNMPIGDGLNGMIDNCMYSGIYSDCVIDYTGTGGSFDTSSATFLETFVLVVINDYDVMGKLGIPGHITQLKYAVDAITGQSTVKKRVGTGNDINTISWGDWTEICGGSDITAEETDSVVSNIEESVVSSALRKTPQVLTESEKLQARENIEAQKELTLTIKDNGNIVIGNIQGETKEFMPATPSGDPMHYAYIAAGAKYNDTDSHIIKDTPWKDYVDDVEYKAQWNLDVVNGSVQKLTYDGKTYEYVEDNGIWKIIARSGDKLIWDDTKVVHRIGHYYLNGLGDITEEEISKIFICSGKTLSCGAYSNYKHRTLFTFSKGSESFGYDHSLKGLFAFSNIEIFGDGKDCLYFDSTANLNRLFAYSKKLKYINTKLFNYRYVINTTKIDKIFYSCEELRGVFIECLTSSLLLDSSSKISKKSILYIIQKAIPTSAITIILHHDAYERLVIDEEIITALTAKNVALATEGKGGKISLACAVHSEEIIPNN